MRLEVSVPATSANLGPGFDAAAIAHDLRNEVVCETHVGAAVVVEGEGAGELPVDGSNLLVRTIAYVAREIGGSLPPLRLECRNRIPLERGLGSSAAAVVAGVLLADRLLGAGLPRERLFQLAVDVEGHPDNVAACLHGGLVLTYLSGDGWRTVPLAPHPALRPALLVPEHERLATDDARRMLPREVPLSDAVFNVGRAALSVVALTERPELLGVALEDRLHQPHRLPLVPATRAMFQKLRDAGIPVCVSGAGPSLLAFERDGATVPDLGPGWRILRIPVGDGARIRES